MTLDASRITIKTTVRNTLKDAMHKPLLKTTFAGLLASTLFGCSMFSAPDREPYYPQVRDVYYSAEEIPVIESNNVLKTAIKQNQFVAVIEKSDVNQSTEKVFAEIADSQTVTLTDLQGELFHAGLETIIKQFSCELYASQQPSNSVQLCPQSNKIVDNGLNYLPFQDGLRYTERLTSIQTDASDHLQLEFFLKSTHERSLDSLWGAVHELGFFKDSTLSEDRLVLTVNLNAYKRSSGSGQWQFMHPEPLVFFIALTSVENILARPNEVEAMGFAYQSAKLLVVDSR